MKCTECGAPAAEQDLFCGECGAILAPAGGGPVMTDDLAVPDSPSGPVYYEPAYDASAAPDSRARVALILGIVSIGSVVLTCVPIFSLVISCVGPVVGIAAIILGVIVKRDVRARGGLEQDWKRANLGMLLGVVGLALYFVFLAFTIVFGLGMEFLRGY